MKFTLWPFSFEIREEAMFALTVLGVICTLIGCITYYNVVTPSVEHAAIQAGLVQRTVQVPANVSCTIWAKPEEARK